MLSLRRFSVQLALEPVQRERFSYGNPKKIVLHFLSHKLRIEQGNDMLLNNIELDWKTRCIESGTTQTAVAEKVDVSLSYVNRIVRGREQIVNKTGAVRQKVIAYLLNTLNVPASMLQVEEHLSHFPIMHGNPGIGQTS